MGVLLLASSLNFYSGFHTIFCKIEAYVFFSKKLMSGVLIAESAKRIPDLETYGHKGSELSHAPIEMKSGDWILKVVPWVGGRIISMEHLPSGNAFEVHFSEFLLIR